MKQRLLKFEIATTLGEGLHRIKKRNIELPMAKRVGNSFYSVIFGFGRKIEINL